MIVISWNCRGINNNQCLRNCKELVKTYHSDIFILLETKSNDTSVAGAFGRKLGFNANSIVATTGMYGGICVFWKVSIDIQVISSTSQVVHLQIKDHGRTWYLSSAYVQPHCNLKDVFWNDLSNFSSSIDSPWLVMGDFNDVACMEEKSVVADFRINAARKFVERWELCGLSDFGATGCKFTWKKRVHGRVVLRERLDRVLMNDSALSLFADGKVVNLPCVHSDHHPILFNSEMVAPPHHG